MTITKAEYANAKAVLNELQRLPPEAQNAILNMTRGAIAISDMYTANAEQSRSGSPRLGA